MSRFSCQRATPKTNVTIPNPLHPLRRGVVLIACCCLLATSVSCTAQNNGPSLDRKAVINEDVKRASQASNEFGQALFDQLGDNNENIFFSPTSISTALSMVWSGAANDTANEIQKSLFVQAEEAEHHAANGELVRLLNEQGPGFEIRMANRLWGQKDLTFQQNYLDDLQTHYLAPMGLVDFINDAEPSRQLINAWVEEYTNDRIKDLFAPGILNSETRLVLVNAIYFKADWKTPFKKEATTNEDFRLKENESVPVPMMKLNKEFLYHESDSAQYLNLPYANSALSMTVILPKQFGKIGELDSDWLAGEAATVRRQMRSQEIQLSIPRFKMQSQFLLATPLQKLGISQAFTDDADFSRMTTADQLKISHVIHKAFVEVNEQGTEAAAATGIAMGVTSAPMPDQPIVFRVDQPFLFYICHEPSSAILFAGRVVDPR